MICLIFPVFLVLFEISWFLDLSKFLQQGENKFIQTNVWWTKNPCVLKILLNKVISNNNKYIYILLLATLRKKVQKVYGTLLSILGTDIYTLDTNIYS